MTFVAFSIGYLFYRPKVSSSAITHKDSLPRYFLWLAIAGVSLSVVGGYQGVDLSRPDLAEIRSNLFQNVSIYAQLGSVLFAYYIFILIEYLHSRRYDYPNLTRFVILGGLITPLFTAGRQLYLYFFLIVFLIIFYKKSYQSRYQAILPNRKLIFLSLAAAASLVLIVLISILRFNDESVEAFGSKLEMFERYSSVEIKSSYKSAYDLMPASIQGLVIEASYYFGAQIGRFSEFYGLNSFDIFKLDALSKFPFIDRNIQKVVSVFGFDDNNPVKPLLYGNISPFTWSTAVSGNILYFGTLGSLFVNFVFGFICRLSFVAYKCFPNSIYTQNFILANSIIIFYGIIASPLMDTFFLFYYLISMYMFFTRVKFLRGASCIQ